VLAVLMVVTCGSWWVWKTWYAEDQLYAAIKADDVAKVRTLFRWGAHAPHFRRLSTSYGSV